MSSFHPGGWKSGADGIAAYYADLTAECATGREPGYWGDFARHLSPRLAGAVKLSDFKALARGLDPATGKTITARLKANRRAVLESVFSAPKSFSVAALVGMDQRLVGLFKRSVHETMAEVERYAAVRVRAGGRNESAPARALALGRVYPRRFSGVGPIPSRSRSHLQCDGGLPGPAPAS